VTGETGQAAPGEAARPVPPLIAERRVRPREVDLFMFSAATWLTHRIHFDRDYARTEGFDDLVVHGPLQGAYLAQLLWEAAAAQGGELASLSYRHHRPAYCAEWLTVTATLETLNPETLNPETLNLETLNLETLGSGTEAEDSGDGFAVEVAVSIRNAADLLVASGQAVLRLPDQRAVSGLLYGEAGS
jgi:acyl dehydratase